MTTEQAVATIIANRSEEGDHRAAAFATALAYRMDQRIAAIDADRTRDDAWKGIVNLQAWKARRAAA